MRSVVSILILVLLAPAASGLTVDPVTLPPTAQDGMTQPEGSTDTDDPHLRVEIVNEGPREWLELRVSDPDAPDRTLFSTNVSVPANRQINLTVQAAEGEYLVSLHREYGSTSSWVATTGCEGAYLVEFRLLPASWGTDGTPGCLVPPPRFHELVATARASRPSQTEDAGVQVPVPRDADRGEILTWRKHGAPDWENAHWARFRWTPPADLPDGWGSTLTGPELQYERSFNGAAGAGTIVAGVYTSFAHRIVEDVAHVLRYDGGALEPFARTLGISVSARATFLGGSAHHLDRLAYDTPPTEGLDCLFRNPVQGRTLRPGDAFPAADLCVTGTHAADARWHVGSRATHREFSALPVHLLVEGERTLVAEAWFADGIPYPLDVEWFEVGGGDAVRHRVYRLDRFQGDGDLLPTEPPAGVTPTVPLEGLHPLDGPRLADEGPLGRVPFPLEDASRAAQSDLGLTGLQALLQNEDAVLAGAVLRHREDAPSTAGVLVWHLVFTAPDEAAVRVSCERPVGQAAGRTAGGPLALCEEVDETPWWAQAIENPPRLGVSDVPARSVTFDEAIARWATAHPETGRNRDVTHAAYRAWDPEGDGDGGAFLQVGVHFPVTPGNRPQAASSEHAASFVQLNLLTGRSQLEAKGIEASSGLVEVPDAITPATTVPSSPPADEATPRVIGAALGAGLLGLLGLLAALSEGFRHAVVGLYSRLTRGDVLDQETRKRIHEAVAREPGIHARAVAERTGGANGLTDYHLGVLVREGVLSCVRTGGFRRYFVAGSCSPAEMRARAALWSGQAEAIHDVVRKHPGQGVTELAATLGMSKSQVSRTVRKLQAAGVLEARPEGRRTRLYAADPEATPARSGGKP